MIRKHPKAWAAIGLTTLLCISVYCQAQSASRSEVTEWTWEVRPEQVDRQLPNVLLVGDSITRNYFAEVQRGLSGRANVYLFAASTSLGDPRLDAQLNEFAALQGVAFRVVHFNNGMHGWSYTEKEYEAAFPGYVTTLRKVAPGAHLIWASTTPVRKDSPNGPSNKRIKERNAEALQIVTHDAIAIDDQYALMLRYPTLYLDDVHFNPEGSGVQGRQAVDAIGKYLQ
ncbi:MAG TPA: SGNH/GDSL hydrolase family protein [Luteibacter sp.]|uniref:SGNH/GDSL hydrolase family protein n=1 Tax=Luteibacter sp. TaxID=1886636 RepID=UPI002CE02E3F|nr:SGNH/GDSL hydrolase family protein [Luteibacter sp.]HVI56072.1 SGNH/GDSL hydrolase family protein [Luteibacter sp.]